MQLKPAALQGVEQDDGTGPLFREICDALPNLVFAHDSEGQNFYVNRAFCQFAGRPAEELLQHRWMDLLHPADLESGTEAWNAAVAARATFVTHFRFRRSDGEWRCHQVRSTPQRGPTGEVKFWVGTAADITELLGVQERLERRSQELQLTLAASSTGLWSWDVQTDRVSWSPETHRLLGFPENAFNGDSASFFELVNADDRARVRETLGAAMRDRELYECEFRVRRADGRELWVANRGRAAYDANGSPVQVIGTVTDITERRRAELAARESEALCRALVANLPSCAAFIVDRELRYRLAAGEALQHLGFDAAGCEGRLMDAVGPEERGWRAADFRDLLRGQELTREHRVGDRCFMTRGAPIRDADGEVQLGVIVSYDVTEVKRAESRHAESEERFQVMADSTPIIIWVTDPNGKIDYVNDHYCSFFGVTAEQVREGGWHPLIHPEDAPYVAAFLEAVRAHVPFRSECRVRHADGEYRWIASNNVPRFGRDGEFLGMVGCGADVTAQKLAEAAARECLAQNELFIAVLGHDLRNPLSTIAASAAVGNRVAESEQQKKTLQRIERATLRISKMIDQVLEVIRVRAGGLAVRPTRVHLAELCAAIIDEATASRPGSEIALVVSGDPAGSWDADRIGQLLANLICNAADYAVGSRKVSVELDGSDPATVTLSVHNEGAIPAHALPALFEPFRRSTEGTRNSSGLGLGLYISREISRAHGGELSVRSTPAEGTSFELSLPRHCEGALVAPAA